ncbi:GntR family transcriptional regulator [Pseudomonas sp. M47T1]|uniref:MocR-like pyridoxine biosynthesis transcription factor PdxR n=1 Tax=Pseudomonas sp. M47T1 TaxID=1179778 RepID=UPI00026089C2|nr:PLP-dependent aminotransferase family protein [Pseudomonas sp. M47T1]EIK95466.1 GntR family transcriptional regulator [Pseudomonas sp. M47T1]
MELHITFQGRKDLGEQLYRQLFDAIENGRLAMGTQLPPTRLLAMQLGVSRKTVADAYSRLTYDNLLSGQVGRGTFVNARPVCTPPIQPASPLASAAVVALWRDMPMPLSHASAQGRARYEFIGGASLKSQFPFDAWRRCTLYALRQFTRARGLHGDPQGLPELREAVARHIGFARGVRASGDSVLITNGAQQALDLVARVLIEPGCTVVMEDPGYPPARLLFSAQRANVVDVPVDDQGLRVDVIPDGTRLIYVTPSHQFPLGMPMSLARRQALLARAAELGAIILEDDYDSEFRYQGPPTDSLQSLDPYGLVVYIGSFSKTLLPELRLGYAVLPAALVQAVRVAKQLSDWHTPTLSQWALAKFISEGELLKHVRRCFDVYSTRRQRILQRLEGDLAPWLKAVPATAGYHLTALCQRDIDVALLVTVARQADIGLYPITPFFAHQPAQQGLLLGFGAIDLLDIDVALDRVRDILLQLAPC